MSKPILIIDGNRNGLALIRALGLEGHPIYCVDHKWYKPGRFSKYVFGSSLLPKPGVNPEGLITGLIEIGKNHQGEKMALLPVNDEYVSLFARNWDRLKDHFIPAFETNESTVYQVLDKLKFADLTESISIPVPERYTKEMVINQEVKYPVIIKPGMRRNIDTVGKGLFKVRLCEEQNYLLESIAELEGAKAEYILQSYIPGGDDTLYTAGVAAWQGKLLGCFTGRKIRQFPPITGEAAYASTAEAPEIIEYAKAIVSATGYSGIAQIEFKKYNGDYFVIEMNPRSWSWNGLAWAVGVPLGKLVIDASQGKVADTTLTNKKSGNWSFFLEDFSFNFLLNRNFPLGKMISQHRKSDFKAFYQKGDFRPFLMHLLVQYPFRVYELILGKKK